MTPDTEHRTTKSNADAAASIVIVSDSSDSSEQESRQRTPENHVASTSVIDKHNGKCKSFKLKFFPNHIVILRTLKLPRKDFATLFCMQSSVFEG